MGRLLWASCVMLMSAAHAAVTPAKLDGPLPQTQAKGVMVWNVAQRGYVAEEFFMSGKADVYAPVVMSDAADMRTRDSAKDLSRREFALETLRRDEPYTTRLVVYRPEDPRKFSGNVIVELFHPQDGGSGLVWGQLNYFFTANGDAYVGVQHPGTFGGLKRVDAQRYAALQSSDNTQLWAMLAQAAVLVRNYSPGNPLSGYAVQYVFMTGISFTGVATSTFANYHHAAAKLANERNVFDGYLSIENATWDRPIDVPLIHLNTQSDYNSFNGVANRRPDGDAPGDRYRRYEIAGLPHVSVRADRPRPTAIRPNSPPIPRFTSPLRASAEECYARFPHGSKRNDFPGFLFEAAAFRNLYAWVRDGVPPPRGSPIEADAAGKTLFDSDGNARGGVRSPYVDVPVATYATGVDEDCMLFGYKVMFDPARNRDRYGAPSRYIEKVGESVARLVEERWILAEDAAFVVGEAASIPAF